MKVSDIPAREGVGINVDGIDCPFAFATCGERLIPVWLSDVSNMTEAEILMTAAYGMPISEHQTLEGWRTLKDGRANMVGLCNSYDDLNDGNDGEVFWVKSNSKTGVWADSKGAALAFIQKVTDELKMSNVGTMP